MLYISNISLFDYIIFVASTIHRKKNSMYCYVIDIIKLQATKQQGSNITSNDKHVFYTSGTEQKKLVTGFRPSKHIIKNLIDYKAISDTMCMLNNDKYLKIRIFNNHDPTEEKDMKEKEQVL